MQSFFFVMAHIIPLLRGYCAKFPEEFYSIDLQKHNCGIIFLPVPRIDNEEALEVKNGLGHYSFVPLFSGNQSNYSYCNNDFMKHLFDGAFPAEIPWSLVRACPPNKKRYSFSRVPFINKPYDG